MSRLPEATANRILDLRTLGLSRAQIAEEAGVGSTTVQNVLRRAGLTDPPIVTEAQAQQVKSLYRQGYPRIDIAREVGVAPSTVDRIVKRNGVRRQPGHYITSELPVAVPRFATPACAGRTDMVPDSEDPALVRRQVAVCMTCVHRIECASWAIEARVHGIWGATSTEERLALRKERSKP